jgi:hypothetical protein
MRFTLSRDGRRRADMRVTVRVGRTELVAALCFAVSQRDMERDAIRTRTGVWETTRSIYLTHGTEPPYFWGDELTADEQDETEAWAEALVDDLFPELREGQR